MIASDPIANETQQDSGHISNTETLRFSFEMRKLSDRLL